MACGRGAREESRLNVQHDERSRQVAILVDYRGAFWSSTKNVSTLTSMNVSALQAELAALGHPSRVIEFAAVDLHEDWSGIPIIFTSSEDADLLYKSYVEDVVLGLSLAGARLIPRYEFLRAHHNKSFMEHLRAVRLPEDSLGRGTRTYGCFEELREARHPSAPAVVKPSAGAGSRGVEIVENRKQLEEYAKEVSRSDDFVTAFKSAVKTRLRPGFVPESQNRRKFIVQPLIADLSGDFKVLVYGRRYFGVHRSNRRGAATASGGGVLDFAIENYVDPDHLLAYAGSLVDRLGTPFLSLDIGHTGDAFHLLEFQAVNFGPATLERSSRHYVRNRGGRFATANSSADLEKTFAEAVSGAIRDEF